jgi:hypothetical protein
MKTEKIENKKITLQTISKWAEFARTAKLKNKRYEFIMNLVETKQVENYRL